MIASRRYATIPAPRLHGLAKLALARIDQGHDPTEAIMAALVDAVDGVGLPSCYDHLSALQREIVLVLWGNGPTRLVAVSRALPERRRTVIWRVAMDLCRDGVLLRVGKGTYRINPAPLELRARPGSQTRDRKLREVLAEGPAQLCDLANRFGVHPKTMSRRLAPLLETGVARRAEFGVYSLTEGA